VDTVQTLSYFHMGPVLSWFATGIVAFLCTTLGLISGRFVDPFGAMFKGLGVELPWPTYFLLVTNAWPLRLVFYTLAVFVVAKEFSVEELRRRFVLTARTFFGAMATAALGILLLYLPVFVLVGKLVGTK
jgi:hypothetical protein